MILSRRTLMKLAALAPAAKLVGIQRGDIADTHGWVTRIA